MRGKILAVIFALLSGSSSAVADEICGHQSVRWAATVSGMDSGGFSIMFFGFTSALQDPRAAAARCAQVAPSQVSIAANYYPGVGSWGTYCGQQFRKCD
jgi:hypothetical protein